MDSEPAKLGETAKARLAVVARLSEAMDERAKTDALAAAGNVAWRRSAALHQAVQLHQGTGNRAEVVLADAKAIEAYMFEGIPL